MSTATYKMPAEWERHIACLILYPHNSGVFRNGPNSSGDDCDNISCDDLKCGPARFEVRNIARAICNHGKEDVFLLCNTHEEAEELRNTLMKENQKNEGKYQVIVHVCESDDSWCRDTGPTFVRKFIPFQNNVSDSETINSSSKNSNVEEGHLVGIDWKFNAYGGPEEGCYWPCTKDQNVAGNICDIVLKHYNSNGGGDEVIKITKEKVDLILEGGSFHTDGEGTILTTEECLLNPNRNPNLNKDQIEQIILTKLGGKKVVWLPYGLANDDDTNGHVDNIATFAKPSEIVLSWTDDVNDPNYERCKRAEELLSKDVDAKGRRFVVHKLYLPKPMYYTSEEVKTLDGECKVDKGVESVTDRIVGERLAGSYVNYYLANEAVILPQFGDDDFDKRAIETMKSIFPSKEVIGVYSREVLLGGGNIHCITQQLPY